MHTVKTAPPKPGQGTRQVRRLFAVTAALAGVLLLGTAWQGRRTASAASECLGAHDAAARARANALLLGANVTLALATLAALGLGAVTRYVWRLSQRGELDDLRAARNERLAALGTMSAVLAHELRNPLASLKGHAQLLAEKLGEHTRERQQAERVVSAAGRMEKLMSDLLEFVRDAPPTLRRTDPGALARTIAADFHAPVKVQVEGEPGGVTLDRAHLRIAIVNLLDNAHQVDPEGLVLVVRDAGDDVEFLVRDSGPGVPPADMERIFEPFVTGRTRGVGLGLAVVRRVAERHGGNAWARNREEGGAEFGLKLPRKAGDR